MVNINKETVEYIADLAKLKLSEKEIAKYQEDLNDVVAYIDKLKKADLKNYLATAEISGLSNVYREDKVCDTKEEDRKALLKNSSHYKNKQIRVKKILN